MSLLFDQMVKWDDSEDIRRYFAWNGLKTVTANCMLTEYHLATVSQWNLKKFQICCRPEQELKDLVWNQRKYDQFFTSLFASSQSIPFHKPIFQRFLVFLLDFAYFLYFLKFLSRVYISFSRYCIFETINTLISFDINNTNDF